MPTKNFTDAKKILNCHICWLLSSLWCLYLVLKRHLDVLWDWIEFCWRWFWVLRCVQYPTKWPSRHFASLKRNQNQLFSAAEACQSTDQDRHKSSRCLQWRLSTPHCQPHHQPHRQPHHQPHRQPRRQRCRQPRRQPHCQPRDCEVRTIMLFSIVIQISWVFILTSSTLWLAWMKSKNCWGTRKDNNLIFCFCSAEICFPYMRRSAYQSLPPWAEPARQFAVFVPIFRPSQGLPPTGRKLFLAQGLWQTCLGRRLSKRKTPTRGRKCTICDQTLLKHDIFIWTKIFSIFFKLQRKGNCGD